MKRALQFIREMMRPMSPENAYFGWVVFVVALLLHGLLIGLLHLAPKRQDVPVVESATGEVRR